MTQQLAPERPSQAVPGQGSEHPTGLVAAAAAVRGAAVAASGLILATGLATLIWAMTPASGQDVSVALRGGVVGFAAANLMPVGIGGVTLTLPPLLFTLVIVALLASTARRGRFLPTGRYQEAVSVLITAVVYGVIVAATTRGFGPAGAVGPEWVWTASVIALLVTGLAMLQPGSAWHEWWVATAPPWVQTGVRGGGAGFGALLAGGGLAVTVGLISQFGDVVSVGALAASSWMDGFGLAFLGLAYLPNAVIAGAGYVTGVGFEIGPGTYSPFATVPVDLPAVPLLAAVPDTGRTAFGLIFLVVPVVAGYLVARVSIRRLPTRAERSLAAGLGAVLTAGLVTGAVAIARGGVGDGRWSAMGSPPLLVAAAVTVEIGVVAVAFAMLTGARKVPWRVTPPVGAEQYSDDLISHGQSGADNVAGSGAGSETGSGSESGTGSKPGIRSTTERRSKWARKKSTGKKQSKSKRGRRRGTASTDPMLTKAIIDDEADDVSGLTDSAPTTGSVGAAGSTESAGTADSDVDEPAGIASSSDRNDPAAVHHQAEATDPAEAPGALMATEAAEQSDPPAAPDPAVETDPANVPDHS